MRIAPFHAPHPSTVVTQRCVENPVEPRLKLGAGPDLSSGGRATGAWVFHARFDLLALEENSSRHRALAGHAARDRQQHSVSVPTMTETPTFSASGVTFCRTISAGSRGECLDCWIYVICYSSPSSSPSSFSSRARGYAD